MICGVSQVLHCSPLSSSWDRGCWVVKSSLQCGVVPTFFHPTHLGLANPSAFSSVLFDVLGFILSLELELDPTQPLDSKILWTLHVFAVQPKRHSWPVTAVGQTNPHAPLSSPRSKLVQSLGKFASDLCSLDPSQLRAKGQAQLLWPQTHGLCVFLRWCPAQRRSFDLKPSWMS